MGLAVQGFRVEEFRVLGLRFRLGFRVSRVQRHCAGFASITSEHKYMGHVNRKSKSLLGDSQKRYNFYPLQS